MARSDAILTFQDGADLEPTLRQPLLSISHAWNMHRPPTSTQNSQRLSFVDAIWCLRAACELWSQVCRVPPHTDRNYSHDQYTWLHLIDRRRAVVQFSSGPSMASKKFCKNRSSSCCPASSCDGYSMEEQLTNARLCHYIFNPLIKPWEWQISPWNQGRTEDFVIEGA